MARKHGMSPSLLFDRRQRIAEGGREGGRVDDEVTGVAKVRRLEERSRDLERLLGKILEIESLEVALTDPRAIVGRGEIA